MSKIEPTADVMIESFVSEEAKIKEALVVAEQIEQEAIAEKGMLATEIALVEAEKVAKRPKKDTIPAALVLTPAEYQAALDKDPDYHRSFDVTLGEPAVVNGYIVFDDPRLPGPAQPAP